MTYFSMCVQLSNAGPGIQHSWHVSVLISGSVIARYAVLSSRCFVCRCRRSQIRRMSMALALSAELSRPNHDDKFSQ